ncbi:MAG: EF-hand domain-containing protein [Rhodospirillales bacterium]|nr:EF-hand domain-containing protein [Rhodospirillales bacterium]
MKRNTVLATASALALAIGLLSVSDAVAGRRDGDCGPGGPGGPGARMMEQFDTDEDGTITREEFDAAHMDRFTTADANGDGEVTFEEFKAAADARRAERMERMFKRLDTDGNGIVTTAETDVFHERRFERLDKNGDGVITDDDLQIMKPRGGRNMDGPPAQKQ